MSESSVQAVSAEYKQCNRNLCDDARGLPIYVMQQLDECTDQLKLYFQHIAWTEWGWRAGVIRASSHRDNKHPELQIRIWPASPAINFTCRVVLYMGRGLVNPTKNGRSGRRGRFSIPAEREE
ncbi:hypothetical protein B566_EDAN004232 [Ephemera danica]|nr:hypothetical protein B566_EDAN004232 [Ephemera danica]